MIEPYKESWINRRSIAVLIATVGVLLGVGVVASRKAEEQRRSLALAVRYQAWAELLERYQPPDPIKKQYVREMAHYYWDLHDKYQEVPLRPWRTIEPDLEAPRRPDELAGPLQPAPDQEIPEVAEARAAPRMPLDFEALSGPVRRRIL